MLFQGYKLELAKVFKDAGFVMSTSKPPPANMEHDSRTTTFASNMFSPFTDVAACSAVSCSSHLGNTKERESGRGFNEPTNHIQLSGVPAAAARGSKLERFFR